jgi:hypothetical protein
MLRRNQEPCCFARDTFLCTAVTERVNNLVAVVRHRGGENRNEICDVSDII